MEVLPLDESKAAITASEAALSEAQTTLGTGLALVKKIRAFGLIQGLIQGLLPEIL